MLGIEAPSLRALPHVSHRFFGRVGGTSPHPWSSLNTSHDVSDAPARVDENLARVRFQTGVPRGRLVSCKQVHGARVITVDEGAEPAAVALEQADALITRAAGMAVGVRTADCAPILLAVDDGSAVGAIHAGWRGAAGGVLEAGLEAMCALVGVPPARVRAAVGPCIGAAAFEVGPEVVGGLGARVDLDGLVREGAGDRSHVDLAGACARILQRAGVASVDVIGGCTVEQATLYFSHRRDHGVTGRQLSVIARASPPELDDEAFA